MTDVTFYLLEQADEAQPAHWLIACQLAARSYRNRQRCIVMCTDKATAEAFDELLWQQPLDSFVPHNLTGEGPKGGAPVEISWPSAQAAQRPMLINLAQSMPERTQSYRHIIDFVPVEDTAKQQARDRYKHYRAAGLKMHTLPASSITEKIDG